MVAYLLQTELAEEIKRITDKSVVKNTMDDYTKLNVFEQALPIQKTDDEDEPYPYCIVRVMEGDLEDNDASVKIILVFGIYDDNQDAQGHKTILNLIQKIHERFFKNPILANKYKMLPGIKWTLQDDDTYPYYFGGVEMNWNILTVSQEEVDFL